jgi:uncharacterized membrane protein
VAYLRLDSAHLGSDSSAAACPKGAGLPVPGAAGLLFMAISASAISASTEVRQYGLLLCVVCGALYATQRAVSESSTRYAIVQGLFLAGAVLTHYTAPVVIIALDI